MFIPLSLCGGTKRYIFAVYLGEILRCLFPYLCVMAQRRKFLQYIWVKYEDVYFFVFVWWHKDKYFLDIFSLNSKMFTCISMRGGTKTYIFANILLLNMKMFICLSLCGGTNS